MNIDDLAEKAKQVSELKRREKTLEENIKELDNELQKYKVVRRTINSLKEEKDRYIVAYIESIKQPNLLDINLINYKALYFFFKKNFIEEKKILYFENYRNDMEKIQLSKRSSFHNSFDGDSRIYLDIKETNFPHLIGYKLEEKNSFGSYDNSRNSIFLNSIYYETNLIEDYEQHGCDLKKIKCISWIWKTLKEPLFVFDQDGIREGRSNLKTDLLFLKKLKGTYHYVSLKKIKNSHKNKYVINSHHKISEQEFKEKYNVNKAIYKFKFN